MFSILSVLFSLALAQEGSSPTLILPSGSTQSLDNQDSVSGRYTVKPAPARPKSREAKKEVPAAEPVVAPQPPPVTAQAEQKTEEIPANEPGLVEVRFAPGFLYNDSNSNYWFREYNSASPSVSISTSIWLSHSFGLECSYLSSLGAEIPGSPTDVSHIPVSHQWFTFGLQARDYNPQETSSQFIYGLKYSDYTFQAPLDSQYRSRLKTSGIGIYLKMIGAKNETRSNVFEVEIYPQTKHKEVQTTITLNSGDKVETNAIALGFGQLYKVHDRSHFFWNFRTSFEKNNFSGTANTVDPKTSQTPSGVTVTNQTYLLEFGYQWGH
jgi:hypothetical protein